MHIYTRTHIYIHTYTHLYTQIHIHTHIYIYTYTHIYYAYVQLFNMFNMLLDLSDDFALERSTYLGMTSV